MEVELYKAGRQHIPETSGRNMKTSYFPWAGAVLEKGIVGRQGQ